MLVHNSAGHVKALDVGQFKDLKKIEKVRDGLEHDHIPSSAALRKAEETRLGRSLTRDEELKIHNEGYTIEVPKDVHRAGDTYKGKNTPAKIAGDAADLGKAAARDYAIQTKNLIAAGYSPQDVAAAIDKLRTANQGRGIG